jgi:hypothetical protein
MESEKDVFDADKPLPSVIVIESDENLLYRIGLSLFSSGTQTRNRFHNPFFISIIISVPILKCLTAILMNRDAQTTSRQGEAN